MSTEIIVRKATKEDFVDIIGMIQELADYEKMSTGPELKVTDLLRDGGFDETKQSPLFFCFVAEERTIDVVNNESASNAEPLTRNILGYSLCFYTYSTWQGKALFMEDIYVRPKYRHKGVGKMIFSKIINYAKEEHCLRLDFHVLKWNPAKKFYEKYGAINLTDTEEWEFYRLKLNGE